MSNIFFNRSITLCIKIGRVSAKLNYPSTSATPKGSAAWELSSCNVGDLWDVL